MSAKPSAGICAGGICEEGQGILTFKAGVWGNNPIAVQILGICSALAVTTRLENSLMMGAAVTFVLVMSNTLISAIREWIPRRIRLIIEVAVIATFVILVDLLLETFYFDMSKRLGAYVGLIITNCIILGRAEAFAMTKPPRISAVDGLANGVGYTMVLAIIGLAREVLGTGKIVFGDATLVDLTAWQQPSLVMALPAGAFIALGFLIALFYALGLQKETETPDE